MVLKQLIRAGAVFSVAGAGLAETPAERGAYLVQGPAACGNCHSPLDEAGAPVAGRDQRGRFVIEVPQFTAIAPSITPGARVAGWSDAQLARAIREGIRPGGRLIGPPMPFEMYRGLSDDDLAVIAAYLRQVPAVASDVPASEYRIPLPPAYGPPVTIVEAPPRGPTAEYGAHLAGPVAHCLDCHTPRDEMGRLIEHDLGRGSFVLEGPWGMSVSANLTSHQDGLAGYDDAEIARMIRQGVRPDGSSMAPPMGYGFYARMSGEDVAAIIAILRTLPPLPDGG